MLLWLMVDDHLNHEQFEQYDQLEPSLRRLLQQHSSQSITLTRSQLPLTSAITLLLAFTAAHTRIIDRLIHLHLRLHCRLTPVSVM